jgi:hypothetical protein
MTIAHRCLDEDADISGLLGMLTSIPDPRSPRGKQYSLEFTLAVCVVAMLAGAKNYTVIARHAADMPQSLLRKLGAKWNWFRFRYQWPGKSAIWNVLTKIDAAMMDREDHEQAWAGEGPQALASLRSLAIGLFRMKTRTPSRKPQNGSAATGCGHSGS